MTSELRIDWLTIARDGLGNVKITATIGSDTRTTTLREQERVVAHELTRTE